jgi:hypothetical protein
MIVLTIFKAGMGWWSWWKGVWASSNLEPGSMQYRVMNDGDWMCVL